MKKEQKQFKQFIINASTFEKLFDHEFNKITEVIVAETEEDAKKLFYTIFPGYGKVYGEECLLEIVNYFHIEELIGTVPGTTPMFISKNGYKHQMKYLTEEAEPNAHKSAYY